MLILVLAFTTGLLFKVITGDNSAARGKVELTACWIWEDDTYFASYSQVAAAVDLAVNHTNNFILPESHSIKVVHQSSGNSCTKTMYSVVNRVAALLYDKGTECNVFIGAGEFLILNYSSCFKRNCFTL